MQFEAERQSKMLSFHCNCLDHITCPGYFVCLRFFSFKVYYFPILLVKALYSFQVLKATTFRFRSIRARRPFDRRSNLMFNQYADLRFVVSLGSSRNAPPHGGGGAAHCKKHMLE